MSDLVRRVRITRLLAFIVWRCASAGFGMCQPVRTGGGGSCPCTRTGCNHSRRRSCTRCRPNDCARCYCRAI